MRPRHSVAVTVITLSFMLAMPEPALDRGMHEVEQRCDCARPHSRAYPAATWETVVVVLMSIP
jgi:hypothetical protein